MDACACTLKMQFGIIFSFYILKFKFYFGVMFQVNYRFGVSIKVRSVVHIIKLKEKLSHRLFKLRGIVEQVVKCTGERLNRR